MPRTRMISKPYQHLSVLRKRAAGKAAHALDRVETQQRLSGKAKRTSEARKPAGSAFRAGG
jgi:hypothetical protein